MKETQVINRIEPGKRIRRLRVENGYQVTDIQRVIGLASPQSVYKWERGDNLPSIDSAVILAWIFDIPVEDLFVLNDSDEEDRKVTACKQFRRTIDAGPPVWLTIVSHTGACYFLLFMNSCWSGIVAANHRTSIHETLLIWTGHAKVVEIDDDEARV